MNRTSSSLSLLALGLLACAGPGRSTQPSSTEASKAAADAGVAAAPVDAPPKSRQVAVTDDFFGQKVADPFRWLEDEKSPEVQAWMKAQDAYARAHLKDLPGRAMLEKRLRALSFVEAVHVPVPRGSRLFVLKRPADKNKPLLYVQEGSTQRVLLDPNGWENGTTSLGAWTPSWDGKKVAFLKHPNAADNAMLYVVDVASGEVSTKDVIDGARYANPTWTPDGKAFYYAHVDLSPSIPVEQQPGAVDIRRHVLGEDPARDVIVQPRTGDPTLGIDVQLSRDGRYLFDVVSKGWSDVSVSMLRVGKDKTFHPLAATPGVRYDVKSWKGQLYILTDEDASLGRLFRVSADHPERAHWKEIVPEEAGSLLQSFAIVGDHLLLRYLHEAVGELRVAGLDGKGVRKLQLPGLGTVGELSGLEDQETAYFSYESFTTPREVFSASVAQAAPAQVWAKVDAPVDASRYSVRQVRYASKDGTEIPMFLVQRKDVPASPQTPAILYGYGGFNISVTPTFRPWTLAWVDAGGLVAVANLRGGGEFGEAWHAAGQLHRKQNVFDDFEAAAEDLARQKLTSPSKLAIYGGSNGGLLVGTAMTQRPELFGAVVCAVPLLDAVRTERFGEGQTWTPEYGTVTHQDDFRAIYAYSPYHHVRSGVAYPPLLMMSSDHDDRVDPLHARKFVAAVQTANPQGAPAYLRIEMHAGHGGADRVDQAIQANADMLAFVASALKMTPGGASL